MICASMCLRHFHNATHSMLNNTGNYVKNEKIFKSQLLYKDEYLKCVVCQFFFYTRGLLKAAMFERLTTRN